MLAPCSPPPLGVPGAVVGWKIPSGEPLKASQQLMHGGPLGGHHLLLSAAALMGSSQLVLASACARAARSRGPEGIPIYNQLREMWRRRLKLTAVLAVLLAGLWLYQGYQGWANLSRFNLTQPWYRRLPGSTAIESWLLGTHTMATVHGSPVAITKSTLQRDFGMDVLLVNRGQTYRLLTACFLHNSIFHIMFNLGYLYTLAPLEVGCRGAFLSTFLLSGIAGNLAFLHFGQARYALGASGGICGLIGFELVSLLRSRRTREFNLLLRSAFGMLVMGIFLPGCATWCHAGGLSAGFLIAFLVARRSGYRAPILPWPLLMGLLSLAPAGREFLSTLIKALWIGVQQPGALARGYSL
ncbi:unnamed protein product [Durusdinium trenchii]|uniref:Peptidase S54 rhomboid domain-containing protein n=1 Tax=Durusdinium trenchii TaxID=1381693 RepID=A0ABP0I2N4_9DINO